MVITKQHFIIIQALLISLGLVMFGTFAVANELQEIRRSDTRIDYKIRNIEVEVLTNQQVIIPAKLFKIWKTLTDTLAFEVGGGIDFNFFKRVERIKMSYGKEDSVAFLPDFEISWHTHPPANVQGKLKSFKPPSVADIIVSIVGNYNLWLVTTGELANDFANSLVLRAYSEHAERLYVVEISLVTDADGIYVYRANELYWTKFWHSKKMLQTKLLAIKSILQPEIDKYFIYVAENKLSLAKAREELLSIYKNQANIDIKFFPWQEVLQKGLPVQLNIIELLQHKRKQE